MRRRKRLIAGIISSGAMTLALAEAVLASMCVPGMDMSMHMDTGMHAAASMESEAPAEDCTGAASSGVETGSHGHQGEHDKPQPECPFMPAAAAQGCTGVASLPSQIIELDTAVPETLTGEALEQSGRNLLLALPLFRPPRP